MKTIWKFPLVVTDFQELQIPEGADILSVQMQSGGPCIWALVSPQAPKQRRTIQIVGTGHPIEDDAGMASAIFIGTVQMAGGALVWHIFERQ